MDKNFFKRTLTCVLILASALVAFASDEYYDFKVNGLFYKIISLEERTCVVCRENENWTAHSKYSGNIVIPSNVNYNSTSFRVVGVDVYAFNESTLSSISFPNTMEYIDDNAFYRCKNLTNIKFPNSLKRIGVSAFQGCSSLTNVNIPSQINVIGGQAFLDCRLKNDLIIPPSCGTIGPNAFTYNFIKNVIISDREGSILLGDDCFSVDSLYMGANHARWYRNSSVHAPLYVESDLYICDKVTFGDNVQYMPWPRSGLAGEKMSQLTIGYNIRHVPEIDMHIMRAIYLRNSNPPLADGFTEKTYVNAILYIPKGSKMQYKAAHAWKNFVNIKEYDVHIPSGIIEKNKPVVIYGHECVEIDGLYWQTKNVGAKSPYDLGALEEYIPYDSLSAWKKIWEKQGWRPARCDEKEKLICSWPARNTSHSHYFMLNNTKFYIPYDYEKMCILFPEPPNSRCNACSYIRLVMDKSRIQKLQEEQRKREEQQRRKEEERRLKARYDEINKFVERNGAVYTLNGADMQYEFALENTKSYDKSKAHTLMLRYTKNGALYMSVNNGVNNELNTLFSDMKLEGTSKQWSEGYYKIASSSSNADVAKELSRILKGMSVAQKIYLQQKKAEEDAKAKQRAQALSEQRKNRQVITRLLSHPLGIESTNWTDSYSSQKKTVFAEFPQIKKSSKSNCINGSLGIEIAIYDRYVSYVFINYMKEEIYVRYTIEAKSSQFRSDLFEDVSDSFLSLPYALKHEDRRVERDKKGIKCKRLIGTPSKQRVLTVEFIVD